MNTYAFKSGSVKIVIVAEDIDLAYNILYAKIQEAAELGIELPNSMDFELYAQY